MYYTKIKFLDLGKPKVYESTKQYEDAAVAIHNEMKLFRHVFWTAKVTSVSSEEVK